MNNITYNSVLLATHMTQFKKVLTCLTSGSVLLGVASQFSIAMMPTSRALGIHTS
jgi:hypothetical protein